MVIWGMFWKSLKTNWIYGLNAYNDVADFQSLGIMNAPSASYTGPKSVDFGSHNGVMPMFSWEFRIEMHRPAATIAKPLIGNRGEWPPHVSEWIWNPYSCNRKQRS